MATIHINAAAGAFAETVLFPGDPEREMELIRKKEGIPLLEVVVNDLKALQQKLGGKLLSFKLD